MKAIRSLIARLQQGFEPMMASDRLNDPERIRKRWRRCVSKSTPGERAGRAGERRVRLLVSSLSNMEAYFAQQEKALKEVCASLEHQVSEAQLDPAA